MGLLAVKALLAPSFVVAASLAARRYGPWLGGLIGGLPVVAGPILLIYALAHGERFAAQAALGALLGLISLSAFGVAYGRLAARMAGRAAWPLCTLAGWAAFGAGTAALDGFSPPAGVALAVVLGSFVAGVWLLAGTARGDAGAAEVRLPAWDLPVRALCALVLVLVLTAVAGSLGPKLSGLLAPFPVIATVLATFTHSQLGARATAHLLRGLLTGYGAFALFCFALAVGLPALGVAGAFALASVGAVTAQALVIVATRARPAVLGSPLRARCAAEPEEAAA
ncbi:MAG: hypothetical protein KGJ43_02090 [Acidobacteriota bacterium]|nr:hypothetical protein [Acidobacteriota bacterium]